MNIEYNPCMQVLLWIIVVVVLVRLALPIVALFFINRALKKNKSVRGHVRRIKLNLIGGVIYLKEIQGLMVDKESGIDSLRVGCDKVEIRVRVAALFRRVVNANVIIHSPDLIYAKVISKDEPEKKERQSNDELLPLQTSPLKTALEKVIPFSVNLTLLNGRIRYIDHTADAKVDVQVERLHVRMMNLSNIPAHASVPARIDAKANIFQGTWLLNMSLKPLEQFLTFGVKLSLKDANMRLLNNFFRSLAKIDVDQGKLSIFMELVAEKGVFNGYIKPILNDLEIIGVEDSNDSFLFRIWERLVSIVVHALENNKVAQIATIVPVEGRFDDPHVDVIPAVLGILKNAFIQGLRPSFENTIGWRSVFRYAFFNTSGFIKKLLG
jgi:hypothetical protein